MFFGVVLPGDSRREEYNDAKQSYCDNSKSNRQVSVALGAAVDIPILPAPETAPPEIAVAA